MPALLHLLPSLAHPFPLCGATDAALVTMRPGAVTCTKCQEAMQAPESLQVERSGRRVSRVRMSEKKLLATVRGLSAEAGYLCFHPWTSVHSEAGFPDVILAKPGKPLLCAELKTMKGRVTRAQQQWLGTLAQVEGVVACVWRPSDLPAIARLLRA